MAKIGASAVERVGLLFVHGIGNQKPFEHLISSVSQLAELIDRSGDQSVNVVDLTADWKIPVGEPTAGGTAPISFTVVKNSKIQVFECHEVFWADLGERTGLGTFLAFWFWGLGQWCAPIYRDNDAAQLSKMDKDAEQQPLNRPISQLAMLPKSVAGDIPGELIARLQLGMAGLAALFSLISWSLLKRLFSAVMQAAPSPTLIVDYVGKVRTYEERAHPGNTALSDPGFPRRVGIRRRMVTQMVAMGARRDIDRWYVLAHSLGSVVAYNGLGEIGHTLPNYLGADQWKSLPGGLKRDPGCRKRPPDEIDFMMPARPSWLDYDDVIDRRKLFDRLGGFVTYGSPLEKFAAIWPRVVATATDRQLEEGTPTRDDHGEVALPASAFGDHCRWLNLRAPLDPVAGALNSFGAIDALTGETAPEPFFARYFPRPETYTTSFWQWYLLAHLKYFANAEAYVRDPAMQLRENIVKWLLDPRARVAPIATMDPPRKLGLAVITCSLIAILALAATATIVAGGGLSWHLLKAASVAPFLSFRTYWAGIGKWFAPVLIVGLLVLLAAGMWRWLAESWTNLKLIRVADQPAHHAAGLRQMTPTNGLTLAVHVERLQLVASIFSGGVTIVVLAWWVLDRRGAHTLVLSWPALVPVLTLLVWCATVQALINASLGPARRVPGHAR